MKDFVYDPNAIGEIVKSWYDHIVSILAPHDKGSATLSAFVIVGSGKNIKTAVHYNPQ